MIFRGKYSFLSNFTFVPTGIRYNGLTFHTVENAYQAAKCSNVTDMYQFTSIPPEQAKKLGRKISIRDDWDEVKLDIMKELLLQKFACPSLAEQLIATGDGYIAEDNYWHDNYWGICNCPNCIDKFPFENQNHLGKLLMEIRAKLSKGEKA